MIIILFNKLYGMCVPVIRMAKTDNGTIGTLNPFAYIWT